MFATYGVNLTEEELKILQKKEVKFFLTHNLNLIDDYAIAVSCLDNWFYRNDDSIFERCCEIIKKDRPAIISKILEGMASYDGSIICYRGTSKEHLYGRYYTLNEKIAQSYAFDFKRKMPCVIKVKVHFTDILTMGMMSVKEIIIQDQSKVQLIDIIK